jgi:hypothetical protein
MQRSCSSEVAMSLRNLAKVRELIRSYVDPPSLPGRPESLLMARCPIQLVQVVVDLAEIRQRELARQHRSPRARDRRIAAIGPWHLAYAHVVVHAAARIQRPSCRRPRPRPVNPCTVKVRVESWHSSRWSSGRCLISRHLPR